MTYKTIIKGNAITARKECGEWCIAIEHTYIANADYPGVETQKYWSSSRFNVNTWTRKAAIQFMVDCFGDKPQITKYATHIEHVYDLTGKNLAEIKSMVK